jgi:endo-1,4-beta-xylanase
MKFIALVAATSSLLSGAFAVPGQLPQFGEIYHRDIAAIEARQGYSFSSWSESGTNVQCNNGNGGSYSVKWNGKGGFVCGKGWNPGSSR